MSLSTNEQLSLLRDINLLSYSPSIDGSLANSRQLKRYAFTPQGYDAGQQPNIVINSGGDYCSGPTSYISMKVVFGGTADVKLNDIDNSNGSIFNVIREFQLSHRSGDVVDRTNELNNLVSELVRYAYDSSYREKFAQVFGYGSNVDLKGPDGHTYCLPLFLFSGVFAQKALIPSQLMAGSKIKIQLENNVTALVSGNVDATYKISDMNLVLDSIDLFDAAKKSLIEQASNTRTQGLQYPYYSWFQLRKSETTTNLNFDINLSAAKTMVLLVKGRTTDNIVNQAVNSMACEKYDYKNWRVRIGSHSIPQDLVQNSAESYMITQEAMSANPDRDMLNPKSVQCGVGFESYNADVADGGSGIVAISLEKSTIVALSGEVTNNSRLLNFTAQYTNVSDRTIDAYIKHLRVANLMLDNVVIDR